MKTSFIVVGIVLFIFILLVCFFYPYLFNWYIDYYCEKRLPKYDTSTNGTFGDMFGGLNTLFSGLAFVGLIATIFVQIYLHKREIEIDRQKQENELKEGKIKHVKYRDDKLTYLLNILNKSLESDKIYLDDLNKWLDETNNNKVEIKRIEMNTNDYYLNIITQKINQEEFFHCYLEKNQNNSILDLFSAIESNLQSRNQLEKLVEDFVIDVGRRKSEIVKINTPFIKEINASMDKDIVTLRNSFFNTNSVDLDKTIEAHHSFRTKFFDNKTLFIKYPNLMNELELLRSHFEAYNTRTKKYKKQVSEIERKIKTLNIKIEKMVSDFENNMI